MKPNSKVKVSVKTHVTEFCFKILSVCFIIALHEGVQGKCATVKTSLDLQNACNQVVSGDTITLHPDVDYVGDFVLSASESNASITLDGSAARILGNKTALKITSGSWTIHNLTIDAGDVGISVEGSGSVIRNVRMANNRAGINLKGNDLRLVSVTMRKGGYGVYVEGDRNSIIACTFTDMTQYGIKVKSGVGNILTSNTVKSSAPGLLLGEASSGGIITSNTASGLSEINGNGYDLKSNTYTGGVNILGCKNVFLACTMDSVYVGESCDGSEQNDLYSPSNTIGEYMDSPIT